MSYSDPNPEAAARLRRAEDPVAAAETATYDALCKCDDVYGDNPFYPVCEYEESM